MNYVEATAEIRSLSGSHFDPVIVDTFMAIGPEQLQEVTVRYHDALQADSLMDRPVTVFSATGCYRRLFRFELQLLQQGAA